MANKKRSGRNSKRPTNKRYTSNDHLKRNKARRAARVTKALAKAKAHTPKPKTDEQTEKKSQPRVYRPLKPRTLERNIFAVARYARAVSKTISRLEARHPTNTEEFMNELHAIYRSPANQQVNIKLRRLRQAVPLAR